MFKMFLQVLSVEGGERERPVVQVLRVIDGGGNFKLFEQALSLLLSEARHFDRFLLTKNPLVKIFREDWVS
jgi:hypothetical protein